MTTIPLLSESSSALRTLARADIVYTDLDGTLLGLGGSLLVDGEGNPWAGTAEAVARLNAAGLTAVITTGRNRIQASEISRLLGWRGFIAELGCVIVRDRGAEPIYLTGNWPSELIAPGDTPFAVIERAGAVELLKAAFPGRIESHAPYHLNREATHLLRGHVEIGEAQALLDTLDVPVQIADNGIVHPRSTGLADLDEIHAYHLLPKGVRKQDAVAVDLARRGLAGTRATAVGDSASDVEVADSVALAVVVANAGADASVLAAAGGRSNVFATHGQRGEGWVEFVDAWTAARGTGSDRS